MSLRYLWDKLSQMDALEQEAYIKNIFTRFGIKPLYPVEDNFKDIKGKQAKGKNPLGYIVMHLNENQLEELIPEYLRQLCGKSTFDTHDSNLYDLIYHVVDAIIWEDAELLPSLEDCYDISDMLDIFEFGVGKYSPWSFMELNPITLVPALFRHMYKAHYMHPIDNESGRPHLAHAACNLRMIELILEERNK